MRRRTRQTGFCQAALAQIGLESRVIHWNGDDLRALGCVQWLAQVAGGKQAILQIDSAHQQNVHIPMELAVLEAIVEDVDANALRAHLRFRQNAPHRSAREQPRQARPPSAQSAAVRRRTLRPIRPDPRAQQPGRDAHNRAKERQRPLPAR